MNTQVVQTGLKCQRCVNLADIWADSVAMRVRGGILQSKDNCARAAQVDEIVELQNGNEIKNTNLGQ